MESIVYAYDWNQARENVIGGAAWFGGAGASGAEVIEQLRKPTALVCSSKGGDRMGQTGGRTKRDDLLLDMIRSSVARGGTVLIPTDTSARVLELAYMLEHAWRTAATKGEGEPLQSAKLHLAGSKVSGTMRLARSMIEWMDDSIVREFEGEAAKGQDKESGPAANKNGGPFTFKHLQIVEKKAKLEKLLNKQGPQVIIASDSSLDWGFSKETLRRIAASADNLIILTETMRASPKEDVEVVGNGSAGLGKALWKWFEERRDGVAMENGPGGELLEQIHSNGRTLKFTDITRAPLEPKEQQLYQQYLATQRQMQNTVQPRADSNLETSADPIDDASSSSSEEDSDSEQQGKALTFQNTLAHSNRTKLALRDEDLGVNILLRKKNVYDFDVRGKKGRDRMFPYVQTRKRGDEYGEFIRPEEYLRAEEREEADGQQNGRSQRGLENKLGQKRRWDDVGANGSGSGKKNKKNKNGDSAAQDIDLASILPDNDTDNAGNDSDASDEETAASEAFEGPAKAVYNESLVTVNARIAFVDFSGLHDKRSLEMLIPLINPRKLILVGGMEDETLALATTCQNILGAKSGADSDSSFAIFTPIIGQTVDASVDTNAWIVKLSTNLVKRLQWQNVRSLGVVALTGQLKATEVTSSTTDEPSGVAAKKQKMLEQAPTEELPSKDDTAEPDAPKALVPILDTLPANLASATRSVTQPLHVGDLRLADLRKLMQAGGHTAEFRGEGTLLIDGFVAVRKSGTGRIEIEGGVMSMVKGGKGRGAQGSFLEVKRMIYEGLAVVAGGA